MEQEIGRRMLERLDYVKLVPKRILDAGSGPSPQADALLKRYRNAALIAMDFSVPMLQARSRPGWLGRLARASTPAPVCADLANIPLAARSCSMVWSNMALHWAANPQRAIEEFHRVLEVEGLLMFSTLGPDTLKELRAAFPVGSGAPHVHGFIDMHDLGDMLVAAGFAAPVMDTETITLTYPSIEAMVADLRGTGQTCALAGRGRGWLGKGRWAQARESLDGRMREGRLPVTVEIVYGHAWKPVPRRTRDGHAIVGLGAVRKR
jgi:malonyl-CoA O-methyltransferase